MVYICLFTERADALPPPPGPYFKSTRNTRKRGGLDRRDESLETTGANGCVDDVLLGLHGQDDEGKGKRE